MRLRATLLAAVAVTLAPAAFPGLAHARRITVERAAVLSRGDTRIGALPAQASVHGTVVLRPRDAAGLTHFIAAATDPASPRFHHYLAAGAFGHRFGATVAARRARGRPAAPRRSPGRRGES